MGYRREHSVNFLVSQSPQNNKFLRPSTMPSILADKIVAEWTEVYTSPFGNSIYSMPGKTWDHTPDGCYRVADHWNFTSSKQKTPPYGQPTHCATDRPVGNDVWTLARFDASRGVFVVIAEYPRTKKRKAALLTVGDPASLVESSPNEIPIERAPRGHTQQIFVWLHDEVGWHEGAFDTPTGEWRDVHGEVLSLEGVVTWSRVRPPEPVDA